MAPLTNKLKRQVDSPVWEWCRMAQITPTTVGCSCASDSGSFNVTSGRYVYFMKTETNFWRYDTWSDTYEQLTTPPNAPATVASMRFAGTLGYFGRVIVSGATTITTGLTFAGSAKGFKISIISGKGAGQERYITSVADPVVADYGVATGGSATTLADTTKTWTTGYVGTTLGLNKWVGYALRTTFGTGLLQVHKIMYSTDTVLTIGDANKHAEDPWCNTVWSTNPSTDTMYQIESSVVTVDTAWDTQPDNTSRYVIQSGGVWLLSTQANPYGFTLQYYDVLADVWYAKPVLSGMLPDIATDLCLERVTEESTIYVHSISTATGTNMVLIDKTKYWVANQWANYYLYIYSGTGRGQISKIASNTANTLTFASITTPPNATSRYEIIGFEAGTSTSSLYNTLTQTGKTWTTNQWANFGVRILAGTGMGQLRSILSNTADTLTLYNNWNVQPSTDSVYVIQGDSSNMYFTWATAAPGCAELFLYKNGDFDQVSHGRILDTGVACTMAAMLCDANHVIYEQPPIAISTIARTGTVATVTTVNSHNLLVGQWVSIRGATTSGDVQYYNGLQQITTITTTGSPAVNQFTYNISASAGANAVGVGAQGVAVIYDGSKDHRQVANGGAYPGSTVTFAGNTPSNINGWYVTGTGISTVGSTYCQVVSGAGTTTLTLSVPNTGSPSGNVITFNAWAPAASGTASSGSLGSLLVTMSAPTPTYINGWYAVGTGIGIGATVVSGAGTANLVMSVVNTATTNAAVTFSSPWGNCMVYGNYGAVALTTGQSSGQGMQITTNTGNSLTPLANFAQAMVAGTTRYMIAKRDCIGAANEGSTTTYYSGVATGGTTTTVIDANAFWSSVTNCTGSAQSNTLTLPVACPANVTGWYITAGAGINVGTQVTGGAGSTSITVSVANSGAVNTPLILCAWNTSALMGKKLKFLSSGGSAQESYVISATAAATGTITWGTAVSSAPTANATSYSIISAPTHGVGHTLQWAFGLSDVTKRGKYLFAARGAAVAGIDRLDLTTDRWAMMHYAPIFEPLGQSSMYAYDGGDRLYFTKDLTMRVYYIDLITNWVHGAGLYPYAAGSTTVGNRMEIFTTVDGLRYLWLNRHLNLECFKQLLFYY